MRLPKIADFACGTGALLNGLYQRILALHEQAGGSGKDIHRQMVENNLVGADIMPNASHLTASIIASTYPEVKLEKPAFILWHTVHNDQMANMR